MPPIDQFPARTPGGSARDWFAITPHATNDLPQFPRAIWVGTGGDVAMIGPVGGSPQTFKNVPSGTLLMFSPSRILAVAGGTTAADMVGIV